MKEKVGGLKRDLIEFKKYLLEYVMLEVDFYLSLGRVRMV